MSSEETKAEKAAREAKERKALLAEPIATVETEASKPNPLPSEPVYAQSLERLPEATPKTREVGIPGWPNCEQFAVVVYRGGVPNKKVRPAGGSFPDPLDASGKRLAVGHAIGQVMRDIEFKGKIYHLTDKEGTLCLGQGERIALPAHLALQLAAEISTHGEFPVGSPSQYGPDPENNGKRRLSGDQVLDVYMYPEHLKSAVAICERRYGAVAGSKWISAWRHLTVRSLEDGSVIYQGDGVLQTLAGAASSADHEATKAQVEELKAQIALLTARMNGQAAASVSEG